MKVYTLKRAQFLGVTIGEAWEFFKNPNNLKEITPKNLGFNVNTNNLPKEIHKGLGITYTVKPILGIPIKWVSEITHVDHCLTFTDQQKKGPYKYWSHKHYFKEIADGVLMIDEVHYALPLGFFGRLIHPIFVRPKLNKIFNYRYKYLDMKYPLKEESIKSNSQFHPHGKHPLPISPELS